MDDYVPLNLLLSVCKTEQAGELSIGQSTSGFNIRKPRPDQAPQ